MSDAATATEPVPPAAPARDLLGDTAPLSQASIEEQEPDFETSVAIRFASLGISVFKGPRRPKMVLDGFGAGRKSAPMELDVLQVRALIAALQRGLFEMGSRTPTGELVWAGGIVPPSQLKIGESVNA